MSDIKKLNSIDLLTSTGDFISLFSIMTITANERSITEAAVVATVFKYISMVLGTMLAPHFIKKYPARLILSSAQFVSAILSLIVIALTFTDPIRISSIKIVFLFISTLQVIYANARDSFYKFATEHESKSHRETATGFFNSLYSAQLWGPIIAFALLQLFPIAIVLSLDFLSFLLTGIMILNLRFNPIMGNKEVDFKATWNHINDRIHIRDLFLLRSVVFWLGIAIINVEITNFMGKNFNWDGTWAALIWSTQGGGSLFGVWITKLRWFKSKSFPAWKISTVGLLILSLGVILLTFSKNEFSALISIFLTTVGAGLNAPASQQIRAEIISKQFFSQVVALELFVGRLVGATSGALAGIYMATYFTINQWLILGALIIFVGAAGNLRLRSIQAAP